MPTPTPTPTTYDDAAVDVCLWEPAYSMMDDPALDLGNVLSAASVMVDALILLDTTALVSDAQTEAAWMQEVLEIFEALPRRYRRSVFTTLDEGPGAFRNYTTGEAWHWKARRTRNHPHYGRRLFAVLAGGAAVSWPRH